MNPTVLARVETTPSPVVLVGGRSPEASARLPASFPPRSRSHLLLHMLPRLHPHLTDTRHLRRRRLYVVTVTVTVVILVAGSRSLPSSVVITEHRRVEDSCRSVLYAAAGTETTAERGGETGGASWAEGREAHGGRRREARCEADE